MINDDDGCNDIKLYDFCLNMAYNERMTLTSRKFFLSIRRTTHFRWRNTNWCFSFELIVQL